jgi:hypothetical protein
MGGAVLQRTHIVVLSLAAMLDPAAGQNAIPWPPSLQDILRILPTRIEEIRETPDGISVQSRGSHVQPDGRTATGVIFISCFRFGDSVVFSIQDRTEGTDDRGIVKASFCNGFRIAVRQRLDAQRN